MNIFFVSTTNTGCSKWRAEIPAKYLARRGHTVKFFAQARETCCPDVIVFARQYMGDVSRLYDWAKSRKLRVVYDTDDALDLLDPWNPAYRASRPRQEARKYMAANADVVTTTTPELADHLRALNPNVVVIPNSIDPEEWVVHPRERGGPIRIGWQGGNSHYLDLLIAAEALSDVVRKVNATFVVFGLTNAPSVREMYNRQVKAQGDRFRNSFEGRAIKTFLRKTERLPYEFQPGVCTNEYVEMLCHLKFDIGIAPLSDTPFNRKKSAIKYYEYAMSGAVTLASNVPPYAGEVPILADNTRAAWKEKIAELVTADLDRLWKDQRDWILAHRNIERTVHLWERVFEGDDRSHSTAPGVAGCFPPGVGGPHPAPGGAPGPWALPRGGGPVATNPLPGLSSGALREALERSPAVMDNLAEPWRAGAASRPAEPPARSAPYA